MGRILREHERNYPAYKKEFLRIIYALKKLHYYLWGRCFTLYTDHIPLTYIYEQKDLPAMLADWKETLLSYDFQCVYRPGILNIFPDALSRAFPREFWKKETNTEQHRPHKRQKVAAVAQVHQKISSVQASSLDLADELSEILSRGRQPYMQNM
jgi:hypothetical protein